MEHLLAKALRAGKLITFEAMHPSMAKLPSAEDATLAFAEVATAIAYLHARGGMAALRAAIKRGRRRQRRAQGGGDGGGRQLAGVRARLAGLHGRAELKTYPGLDIPTTHIRKPGAIASRRKPSEDEALSPAQGGPRRRASCGSATCCCGATARAPPCWSTRRARRRRRAGRGTGRRRGGLAVPGEAGAHLPGAGRARRALKALGTVQTLTPTAVAAT